jgi:hypothetical protein
MIVAASFVLGSFVTLALQQAFGLLAAQRYVLILDALVFLIGLKIALCSTSYWPLWFCGLLLVSVATSIASLLFPTSVPAIYVDLAGFWAIPALASAAIGVIIDGREAKAN